MLIHSPEELALQVIRHRKKFGLSQTEIADRVGLKQKTISAFENNPQGTKLETLFRILSAVNLDLIILSKDQKIKSSWNEEW